MTKMITSAYAAKLLKNLEDEKNYWMVLESNSCVYTVTGNEDPVIPAYDFTEVTDKIEELDAQIVTIKHALNKHNVTAEIAVEDRIMSVDEILVTMAQMNRRRSTLDMMRKRLPKTRQPNHALSNRTLVPEYVMVNYDLNTVKEEYEYLTEKVMAMQMALDRFNQTVEFALEVD